MNKKGFAISGLVYSILILFLILITGILGILGSRKIVLDKMKNNVISDLNDEQLVNVYQDDSGANYPRLTDRMIPVIYDEAKSKWVYANIYEKWYDYDDKMWANAVILKNNVVKAVGQTIEEDEIALMYVWIPRYKYVMFNAHNESVEEQQIQVIFENGTNSTGTVRCVDAINQKDENGNPISEICVDTTNGNIVNNVSTYTHPAFTFGDDEIEGFWVGKFENSTTDSECSDSITHEACNKDTHVIEIKANVYALTVIDLSNMFSTVRNIKVNYGIHDGDSHVMKNMEWGAVTYLTQSKYGKCTNGLCGQINNNNSYKLIADSIGTNYTGCSANDISAVSEICDNSYNTDKGIKASTTGNIYGIYDMAGGSWDSIMATAFNDGFSVELTGFVDVPNDKYIDIYSYGSVGKLGDATFEMTGMAVSQELFYPGQSWLYRGGHGLNYYNNSFFTYLPNDGHADDTWGFRSILIKQ